MTEKQSIAEEALEIVEDQVEVLEESVGLIKRIIWNHKTHVGVAFVAGAGLGGAVTYKVVEQKLKKQFELLLDEEIEKTKEHYSRKHLTGDYETPEKAAAKLLPPEDDADVAKSGLQALRNYQGTDEPDSDVSSLDEADEVIREEVRQSKRRNIFDNAAEEFDWEAETEKREALADTAPYVITFEEFHEDDDTPTQQLTYFAGDGVLADENDMSLTDEQEEALVGEELHQFGYGSKDPNVVFIRNPRVNLNMEIVRSPNSYAKEVYGFDDETELKHSQRRPRFRNSDE